MKDVISFIKANKTQLIPVGLVALLAVLSLSINGIVSQRTELRSRAAADNGQLTFSVPVTTVPPGQTFDASVNLVNGGQTVVGADIIVQFDSTKLTLQSITPGTSQIFKTFVPVTTAGVFDSAKVVANANGTNAGKVEFGIVTFDWAANALTAPTANNTTMSPVATLRFLVKSTATGTTQLTIKNDGTSATTDSNIVVIPAGGQPEDILQAPGYANDSKTITISTTASPIATPNATPNATPVATPIATPVATPNATPVATPGSCTARLCQDFNNNGIINITDVQAMAFRYGASTGSPNYAATYDLDCNGTVNVLDMQKQAFKYNQSCQ